ncbi:sensor histidine kinase, partial [Planctomycetota bacterium]
THRLLGFAKRMDVQADSLDLEHLLKEVLGFLEKEAALRSLAIGFHVGDDLPLIVSDRGQLQQVFLNILNNAFAAVEDKGHIDIGLERVEDDSVAVTITDDGHGIPKELQRNIFDPFFSTKGEYGTGLGLSITHGIVGKLGGKIRVRSEVNQGTAFTIELPINRVETGE